MLPVGVLAQDNRHDVPRDETAFVLQAPASEVDASSPTTSEREAQPPPRVDASSKVYFPEEITPESVASARARIAQSEQLPREQQGGDGVEQVSHDGRGRPGLDQVSVGGSSGALAQLSDAERQVLLDAVEGTDICDQSTDIPALRELCETRLETRSAEFAENSGSRSAEDSLLGGGLDSSRLATLEAAISRLASNAGSANDFSNQVIASVTLGNTTLSDAQATSAEGENASELSEEAQAVVSAIVQQIGGN